MSKRPPPFKPGDRVRTVPEEAIWPIVRAGTIVRVNPSLAWPERTIYGVQGDEYLWTIAYYDDELEPLRATL